MELLAKLAQAYGASGNESVVRDIIISEIKKYCDDYEVDAMGNLIAHKKGNGVKVMFAAHMDEIGLFGTNTSGSLQRLRNTLVRRMRLWP